MAGVNQLITKGISLVTKYADDAARVASTSSDDVARYVKACGKKSIFECKPLQGKINPEELGVIFPDGQINFQNEESALKYIKARLHDALNRPQSEQFERVIVKRGSTIIGEGDGTSRNATVAFEHTNGVVERINKDVPRDLEVFHSHPDYFGVGKTTPLSSPDGGDIETFFKAKLKKIVAMNSKGEFNSIEVGKDFSSEKFKLFQDEFKKFEDDRLFEGLLTEEQKLSEMSSNFFETPGWLSRMQCENTGKILERCDWIENNLEKVSKLYHEYYQKAKDYGMVYSTNFSNLT